MEVYTSTKLSGMGEIFRLINTSILILIVLAVILLILIIIAAVKKHLNRSKYKGHGANFIRKDTEDKKQ